MKRLFLFVFLMQFTVCWNGIKAQDLKFRVAECYLDQQDMTAHELAKDDGDGAIYAIIKVSTDNEDDDLSQFLFDFNFQTCTLFWCLYYFIRCKIKPQNIRKRNTLCIKHCLKFIMTKGM